MEENGDPGGTSMAPDWMQSSMEIEQTTVGIGNCQNLSDIGGNRVLSFKDKLMSGGNREAVIDEIFLNDAEDSSIPVIKIDLDSRKRIFQKWKWCVIGKVHGKTVGYKFIHEKVHALWNPSAQMGIDFFPF